MSDERRVPPLMSLEGRAQLIADTAGQLHDGPQARRDAVYQEALAHLRAAVARAANGEGQ